MKRTVSLINSYRDRYGKLTDDGIKEMTSLFRQRIENGESMDAILPEAFALVREASKRTIGLEHFDVQMLGGIALHEGKIAEMKTGEGKTLVATLPVYLNALSGKGVHVVTVNEYLAERDAEWMGQVYNFLGLSVGISLSSSTPAQKREAYACDITYVTNNEVGFDYLRDNMAQDKDRQVLRGLEYCVIDEVDSVLIDEARTPLIISGQSGKSTGIYKAADSFVKTLKRGDDVRELTKADIISGTAPEETGDFVVNEKEKYVNLTAQGVKKAESFFGLKNLSDPENAELMHCIAVSLRANSLMKKDRDYIVRDNEVLIVDEFTGRVMEGRRYSDGLHQAIEAKENVEVNEESSTYATITFQNFFNKYRKKSGMTGTAMTEKREFMDIYGLDIVEIPTNVPVIRNDMEDAVFRTCAEKYEYVIKEIKKAHETGQPVLVGTTSIQVSEHLSSMLKKEDVPHNVLNAKEHAREAEIIADAGHFGSVTIATNMAGRGTDIKLDEKAKEAGGLYVIGTERHESRRIDNQLRGRSGRQGDPGKSKFFLSLEDDILRLFGAESMKKVFDTLGIGYGEEVTARSLSKSIERAQKRVEGNNYNIRKNLLAYDRVNNEQREIIYGERQQILDGADMKATVSDMITDVVTDIVEEHASKGKLSDEACVNISRELSAILKCPEKEIAVRTETSENGTKKNILDYAFALYGGIENAVIFPDIMRKIERTVLLRMIDNHWKTHLDQLERLRQSVGMMAMAQKDPRTEYRTAAFDMFEEMMWLISRDAVSCLYGTEVSYETNIV